MQTVTQILESHKANQWAINQLKRSSDTAENLLKLLNAMRAEFWDTGMKDIVVDGVTTSVKVGLSPQERLDAMNFVGSAAVIFDGSTKLEAFIKSVLPDAKIIPVPDEYKDRLAFRDDGTAYFTSDK